jgi:hypothetical protein
LSNQLPDYQITRLPDPAAFLIQPFLLCGRPTGANDG